MSSEQQREREQESSEAAAGAGLVSVGTMIASVVDLLLIMALTRLVDRETFGLCAFVFMVQMTLRAIGSMGLPEALFYFVPKLGPKAERALGVWSGGLLLALATPLALGLWVAGPWLSGSLGTRGAEALLGYLALFILADFPAQVLPSFLLAKRAYRPSFAVTLLFSAARFGSVVIPAWQGAGIEGILLWYVIVGWARLALSALYLLVFVRGGLRREGWRARELFAFGAPMAASRVVGRVNRELDKYMVLIIFTPAIYGVYTVGAQEVPLVGSIAYSVTSALLPTLVLRHGRGDIEGFIELWHGSMTKAASIMMPVFFACFVLADPLMRLIYSDAYAGAAVPFRVYLCLLPLRLCGYGAVVRALGKTKPVVVSAVIGLVINAGLNYPLFLLFDLAGPGIAAVLAQLAAIVCLLWAIRLVLGVSWAQIFPYRAVLKAFGVAAAAAAPLWLLLGAIDSPAVVIAMGFPLYLLSYLVVARLTGVITNADLKYLKELATLKTLRR